MRHVTGRVARSLAAALLFAGAAVPFPAAAQQALARAAAPVAGSHAAAIDGARAFLR
ncbi:MAG TPA: hypothetical protein VHG51_03235 [Longimicrobiaceae bacterium]|nr:hypothetical protein [Longimicrobiaceae bacterium]